LSITPETLIAAPTLARPVRTPMPAAHAHRCASDWLAHHVQAGDTLNIRFYYHPDQDQRMADVARVLLLRSVGDNQFGCRELNTMRIIQHKDRADGAVLAQDDLTFIPQTGIAKASVWVEQYIRNMLPFGSPIRPTPVGC
jgi:hypothetical protein